MIDKRELMEKSRERKLGLQFIEKDYVLGWLLYGMKDIDALAFKGGTALSKIYFPEIWRLSEYLDFAFTGNDFAVIKDKMHGILEKVSKQSLIKFKIKSEFSNPLYLQLKIGYEAVVSKNWIKVDATRENVVDNVEKKELNQSYSDYPVFSIKVESLEEIFSKKIRSLIERTKCRDYFDVWKLCSLDFDQSKLKRLFRGKCETKGIQFKSLDEIFPDDLEAKLYPYWEQELGRLLNQLPDLNDILADLKAKLHFITS